MRIRLAFRAIVPAARYALLVRLLTSEYAERKKQQNIHKAEAESVIRLANVLGWGPKYGSIDSEIPSPLLSEETILHWADVGVYQSKRNTWILLHIM